MQVTDSIDPVNWIGAVVAKSTAALLPDHLSCIPAGIACLPDETL
jgi:hypothetical protein